MSIILDHINYCYSADSAYKVQALKDFKDLQTTPSKAWMKRPFTKSSCALRCATAASSTRRISMSTSPSTAMRRWARC